MAKPSKETHADKKQPRPQDVSTSIPKGLYKTARGKVSEANETPGIASVEDRILDVVRLAQHRRVAGSINQLPKPTRRNTANHHVTNCTHL